MGSMIRGRALVLGAGTAGLLAARVLSDHFELVTVVERDRLPDSPTHRPGVPQSQHLHGLLLRGKVILERYFPGLQSELAADGAPYLDLMLDLAAFTPRGWAVRFPSPLGGYSASRALLEWTVRKRVAALPNVAFLEETVIQGLVADDRRVVGARLAARGDAAAGDERCLRADLVVDATGRGSHLARWLREMGYPAPDETAIDPRLGYATRVYRIPDPPPGDWKGLFIQVIPHGPLRGGVLQPVEGERWMVTVGGAAGDYPPTDPDGFLEFTRTLASPTIYEAIRNAAPLSVVYGSRSTVNVLRHYERLARFPEGLVALGDAVCAFDPIYGQGMTTAALGAEVLDDCLRRERSRGNDSLRGLSRRFQARLARSNRPAWDMAAGQDLRVPGVRTVGIRRRRPGPVAGVVGRYIARAAALSVEDVYARLTFNEVISLVRPPTALFHPRMVTRVLFGPVGPNGVL